MSSWVRRRFDGIGLTQSPPGPHLPTLQAKYGGTVLLCIDVSGSMSGEPLRQAIKGGTKFLAEAEKAHYRCGLVLWSDRVDHYVPPSRPMREVSTALQNATICGGTELAPALRLGKEELGPRTGDRVLCVFSDGGLGDERKAKAHARELCAMGVRIIVRGLGHDVAGTLADLACPGDTDDQRVIDDVSQIGSGIASMATGLTTRRRRG
jgi:predicted metal-dependent peptidase